MFLRIGLLVALPLACSAPAEQRGRPVSDSPGVSTPNAFWADVGVVFSPDSVAVDDTVGWLVVDRVAVTRAYDSSAVGSVKFGGELELKGRLIPHFDSDLEAKCFEADSASAARMPRWQGDMRRPWFCFSNQEDPRVVKAVVPSDATIVIDRYTIRFTMSDAVNEARLLRFTGPKAVIIRPR